MSSPKNLDVPVEDLLLDLENPRYPTQEAQLTALRKVVHEQGPKLIRLATDIVDKGLNPSKRLIVTQAPSGEGYFVLEGNRRLAALKLLVQKDLRDEVGLGTGIKNRLSKLAEQARESDTLPQTIECVEMTREDAKYWIKLEHTGENQGVGVVGWNGPQARRFRGGSPALQAIDIVQPYLDAGTQELLENIAHTNIERILGTPEARSAIGITVQDGHVQLLQPQDQSLARLAAVVADIAHRRIRVTNLDTKQQRIDYAKEVAGRKLPAIAVAPSSGGGRSKRSSGSGSGRKEPRERKRLIPRHVKLTIKNSKLNNIYDELQRLNIVDFTNSAAVLFRVFVELSCDQYAEDKSLTFRTKPTPKPGSTKTPAPRDFSLKEKLEAVAEHLERKNVRSNKDLKGVRDLARDKHGVLTVETLHAYVHGHRYTPSEKDLTRMWDNIEIFITGLWN